MGDFIYIIELDFCGTKTYKVGVTNNVKKRIKALASSCPRKPKLMFEIKHDKSIEIEKAFHLFMRQEGNEIKDLLYYREWYSNINFYELIYYLMLVVKDFDNNLNIFDKIKTVYSDSMIPFKYKNESNF